MGERTCSVDDCTGAHYGRGWCQLHYGRVRKYGTPDGKYQRRTPQPCKLDGCERIANVPGSAHGWCGRHYQRWQRYGDPLGKHEHEPVVGIKPCSIVGCSELVKARGWCVKHWTRWQRFGDPEARLRGEVRDGRRICPGCSNDLLASDYSPGQAYCRRCSVARTAAYRALNPYIPVERFVAECDECGQSFSADKRRSKHCSRTCLLRSNWKYSARRRARIADAFVELFERTEIFDRDKWVCQICLEPVDRTAKAPNPKAPSLDHIIPIARGGKHSRANAQTACLGCNVRKGAKLIA